MEFPITDLLSPEASEQWLLEYFHPDGLKCPKCQSPVERANIFRVTRESELKTNCFKMRGKKGDEHFDPLDPPRRRANKRRGRGTYENDRPPVLGVTGRESGQVRLRVVKDTKALTLEEHVHAFTWPDCHVYTDEYDSYQWHCTHPRLCGSWHQGMGTR